MTTEHPMFLKMKVEKFGRKMSFGAPKWNQFFDLPFKVQNAKKSYDIKIKKNISKQNSVCVFCKFNAYETDHVLNVNEDVFNLD